MHNSFLSILNSLIMILYLQIYSTWNSNSFMFYNIIMIYKNTDQSFFMFQIIKYQIWTSGESFWRLETTYNDMLEIKPFFWMMFLVGNLNQVIEKPNVSFMHIWQIKCIIIIADICFVTQIWYTCWSLYLSL